MKVSAFSETTKFVDDYLKLNDATRNNELDFKDSEGEVLFFEDNYFIIKSAPEIITDANEILDFNPSDAKRSNFQLFNAQLNGEDPLEIVRLNSPSGYDTSTGVLVEVNLGIAEAVLNRGEIKGFNIINKENGFPSNDALLIEGENEGEALEIITTQASCLDTEMLGLTEFSFSELN